MAALQLRHAVLRQLVVLTLAHFAVLLLLGTGSLTPPEQTALVPFSSLCVAPPSSYATVGVIDFFFAPAATGAIALAGYVACHQHQVAEAAGGGAGAGAATRISKLLRALTLLAVLLSATAAGLAMAASFLVLQVKAGTLACLSGPVRVSVYASYLVVGPILALSYVDLARMALLSD